MLIKTKKMLKVTLLLVLIAIFLVGGLLVRIIKYESNVPQVTMTDRIEYFGAKQTINAIVTEEGAGLRSLSLTIVQNGKTYILFQKEYDRKSQDYKLVSSTDKLSFEIEPLKIGLQDGEATLEISAKDYSWRNWFSGNEFHEEYSLIIDTQRPDIATLSSRHYLNQGGSGLIIYKISEDCPTNGVVVGSNFFPGYNGYFQDPSIYIAFIALAFDQGPDTEIYLSAEDKAGNKTRGGISYHINKRQFKKDTIGITDRFLNWKMPDFQNSIENYEQLSLEKQFLFVNQTLRKKNYDQIMNETAKSDASIYWNGVFARLPNAANRAGFADHRTYTYNGEKIDEQNHLGIDLASLKHSPVPAANSGRVAFAGPIGIYGKTVILDHGMGLFSMYSHLNELMVDAEQVLEKGEIVGNTGTTGLAGGDHLHFSIIVHDTFVNPVEWWDENWIKNNINSKIQEVLDLQGAAD